jgi:mitogen-activated protein kinase kinase kinase
VDFFLPLLLVEFRLEGCEGADIILVATFKWVKGQLIGRGSFGRVYHAMNLTTGEMIAVKQVELPKTDSDRADSRQVTVVDALKSESDTLRDLDHPHIVQYLGFEETVDVFSV